MEKTAPGIYTFEFYILFRNKKKKKKTRNDFLILAFIVAFVFSMAFTWEGEICWVFLERGLFRFLRWWAGLLSLGVYVGAIYFSLAGQKPA